MPTTGLLEGARAAYRSREWATARDGFRAAQAAGPLAADDLYALSDCAWWMGEVDAAVATQQEAYQLYLAESRPRQAAIVAVAVGYTLALRGNEAQASGWISRASRLLAGEAPCAEQSYLGYLAYEQALGSGDLDSAYARAADLHAAGERFGDPNLVALGVLGQGRVLVKQGRVADGMALLDEAMVAAVSDTLDPGWAGNIYCNLMLTCHEMADLRRAAEWTAATARWCESMPGAGPFMGICRVHRAQVLHVLGDWDAAEREAARVCAELPHFHVGIVAEAHYQLGEVRRHRGDLAPAEQAYVEGHRLGRDPLPGLALLRLAQGRIGDAAASIRRALATPNADALGRAPLLRAAVDVFTAAGELDAARAAAAELSALARTYGTAGLHAQALTAEGAVLVADGQAADALSALRDALAAWRDLRAPYDVARVRELLARAYDGMGDHDAASLERAAADAELARLRGGTREAAARRADGITTRQAEILALVAAGRSNQEIADELVLSVRTVERHLATAYQRLGLSGRSARTAAVRYAIDGGRPAR